LDTRSTGLVSGTAESLFGPPQATIGRIRTGRSRHDLIGVDSMMATSITLEPQR
jgi:hypothetical protein